MNGQMLDYSAQTNSGLIPGDDGNRYNFVGAEWEVSSMRTILCKGRHLLLAHPALY